MSFEFNHTCPSIDSGISDIKEILTDHLDDLVSDLSPMFHSVNNGIPKNEYIKSLMESIYGDIEHNFEDIRKTNEDMRDAADDQITNLELDIEELKGQIEELEKEI